MKKFIAIFLIILLLLTFTVHADTRPITVIKKEEVREEGKSFWSVVKSLWWVGVLIVLVLAGSLWLIWWLIKKIKEGDDVWYQIMKDKKHLCKVHRDKWRVRAFFKYHNNCPIKLYYTNDKHVYSKVVGHYKGHYLSHDGNLCVLFNCRRKWLVFPRPDLLFLNTKETVTITKQVEKTVGREKKLMKVEEDLSFPYNFYQFNPDEIIIYAYGIDMDYRTGFYYPVLRDKQGRVINMALPVYEAVKQIAIEGYLYDQTDDFVKVAKKSIDLNPTIRGVNKVSDSSSSIDTQQQPYRQT